MKYIASLFKGARLELKVGIAPAAPAPTPPAFTIPIKTSELNRCVGNVMSNIIQVLLLFM